MKKVYEAPVAQLEIIETKDIITVSGIDESLDFSSFAIIEMDFEKFKNDLSRNGFWSFLVLL